MSEAQTPSDPQANENRNAGLGPRAAQLVDRAGEAIQRRDLEEAERALAGVNALAPNHAEVLRLNAVVAHMRQRYKDALELLRRADAAKPDDALIWNNLGSALGEMGDIDGALNAFRKSCELAPRTPAAWFNLGKALEHQAYTREAQDAIKHLLDLDPKHLAGRVIYAQTLRALGRTADAAAEYRHVLTLQADYLPALMGLVGIKTVPLTAEETAALGRIHARRDLTEGERVNVGFALMQALEGQQRYTEAFAIATNANATRRRQLQWDSGAFSRRATAILSMFAAPLRTTSPPTLGEEVIFVVSMPRSGSTLTEQILAAHPEVEGANELDVMPNLIEAESRAQGVDFPHWVGRMTPADWERLGRLYLERTARWREKKPRFTDKALSNWQYTGALRAMLPGSIMINCRRDPVETCLSCFRQAFATGQAYTYDMNELVAFYRDYDRLSKAWVERCPDYFHELVYEELLTDTEGQIRRLLDLCRLSFDPACLRSHEVERNVRTASAGQVREPLRRDTARAARYGALLAPMRRALGVS
ncbi:MAG TPA: sulfotransferase [Rhodanobacteraceae bacterium]